MITTAFQVQLETATQWDSWSIELESNMNFIIRAKWIALSYVIREDDDPNLADQETWEYKAMLAEPHKGNAYLQDKLTVNNVIIHNIADGSDAFTYVKLCLKKDEGILGIQSLRGRYENAAMHEQYINEAESTLETLTYRNERALKFEKFVDKFAKAVDELDQINRGLHNADVVDIIWKKVTNPELNQYVVALKVQFQREPQNYQEVLQYIASKTPTFPINIFRKASEVGRIFDENSGFDECPNSGAYGADGKLYIGKYPYQKWKDNLVRPHWKEICSALEQQGIVKDNGRYHVKKKKHSDLESKISQLIKKKARMEASISSIVTDGIATGVSTLSCAGDSF